MGYNSKDELMDDLAAATYAAATDTLSTDAPAGGTGATGGAYDNATNRDAMIVTVNALNATVASMLTAQAALAADVALIRTDLNA